MRLGFFLFLFVFLISSCLPVEEETIHELIIDRNDPQLLKILDFQDQLLPDSLARYLRDENPSFRYTAAMAFASLKDSSSLGQLQGLLNDPLDEIRAAAAYALGQIGSPASEAHLVSSFRQYDSLSVNSLSNSAILEAAGKCGSLKTLQAIATVKNYQPEDSLLLLGQARAIYQFGLRGLILPEGTGKMIEYAVDNRYPVTVRIAAANYLLRAKNLDLGEHVNRLILAFEKDPDPRIRMCLAVAIGKSKDAKARASLKNQYHQETDYRVVCNILRALNQFEYENVRELFFLAVTHENLHVARIAAQFFVDNGVRTDALRCRNISKSDLPWQVKALMYEASNKHLPIYYTITKANIKTELIDFYQKSQNPYEKGMLLKALARDIRTYRDVWNLGFSAEHPIIRTNAVEALSDIAESQDFQSIFLSRLNRTREEITSFLIEAITSGDVALIAVAAQTLRDENTGLMEYAGIYLDTMVDVLARLELPGAVETYNELNRCISALQPEKSYQPLKPDYNHPINWNLIKGFGDTLNAEIITTKGLIEVDLFADSAPGTVANFIQLSRDRFYEGKNFHRVVPNFVIQGGCPRGDGYGSLDYTIRSELPPLHYDDEGYLGMASAGNHTECTQWFITHSPTPHLDGNYTIFGKVTEGMEIVHNIAVGDIIEQINVVY
jgi:cyclophilin family peptidyl-prolyl cis-trans isomerase/HEAT repeat protein